MPDDTPGDVTCGGMIKQVQSMQAWHERWLKEAYRVLVPGGVIKAFSATRTWHRLAMAMKNVGFEEISTNSWCYGSGFPKSLSVEKAINAHLKSGKSDSKQTGGGSRDREGLHWSEFPKSRTEEDNFKPEFPELSNEFKGFGSALKPAWEIFVVGKKPLK